MKIERGNLMKYFILCLLYTITLCGEENNLNECSAYELTVEYKSLLNTWDKLSDAYSKEIEILANEKDPVKRAYHEGNRDGIINALDILECNFPFHLDFGYLTY